MPSALTLIKTLNQFVGVQQYSPKHLEMVTAYNRRQPLPVGYKVQAHDDWCDVFVTYIADLLGFSQQIGRECGVQRHLELIKQKGRWLGKVPPKTGDILFFDWDGGGFCDHIGFVELVSDTLVTTIEGNVNGQVSRCKHALNSPAIVGYARPLYQEDALVIQPPKAPRQPLSRIVLEVIRGVWGNGVERVRRLREAGYDAMEVQASVNDAYKRNQW